MLEKMVEGDLSFRKKKVLSTIERGNGVRAKEIRERTGLGKVIRLIWRLRAVGLVYRDETVWKAGDPKILEPGQSDPEQ